MSVNDLPGTVDAKQNPISISSAPQSTTAPATEASTEATTGLDLRGYELQERLGGGGMGDVYRASDPALGRDLAVKVMKAELQGHAAAEQRFRREARITGSLQHPGIVPIYNLGRLRDGRLHYTMRLVRGRTFADILREEAGQLERLPALLAIFEKVCQAVAYAHSKQVIHRDLKPANVMVGRFGEVQVMDWGLAKLMTAEEGSSTADGAADGGGTRIHTEASDTPLAHTRMGHEMGTPAYMSPEQALGEWDRVDERADVFALGAILCEILTGRPPYRGDSREVLRKAKQADLAEASARLEICNVDTELRNLCRECLSSTREGRPNDAEQVAHRVAAYQTEVQERLRQAELERAAVVVQARWERKKRRWISAGALLLLAGGAVIAWEAVRATKAEDRALTAADAERQAKDQAQLRQGEIKKGAEVLASIFRDLDPDVEEQGGPSLRQQLSQHLQRAATQLDERAVGDPVTIAHLQAELGQSLDNLGQAKLAMEVLSKAVTTLESQLGPDHPDTLHSRSILANACWSAGHTAEAIRLNEQNLKMQEVNLGPDHPETLNSRTNLANSYRAAGRISEAIRLHELTLKQKETKLGPDHPDTLKSRNNLATAYYSAGRNAEAMRLLEQTLKQMEASLGPDHPTTLNSRNNLAESYRHAGRTAEAIRLHELTLKQQEAKLGTDHPKTLASRTNLAAAYLSAGRTAEAARLHELTLKQQEAKLGPDHPSTLKSRSHLANAYSSAGRIAEAIRLHEQNLKTQEAKLGTSHPDTLNSRNNLAAAYYKAGRTAEAILLFEQILKRSEATLGTDHPTTLASRNNLATVYSTVGRLADAGRLHEQNLKASEARLGADHPDTLLTMANLSATYRDTGRVKEAIHLLETALQRGRQRSGGLPASLARFPDTLAQTYERAGEFAKAESIYRDSLKQVQRRFGPDDLRTAGVLDQLGNNLLKQKKFPDAESLLRRCLKTREAKQPDEWTTYNTRSMLGEALLGQKKYTEAEPLLVQGYEGIKKRQGKMPPPIRQLRLSEALERLVRLYEATDQKNKAADWRKKLDEGKAAQKKNKP